MYTMSDFNILWFSLPINGVGSAVHHISSPNGASQKRVKGIQPIMHVLVIAGLQQNAAMLRANSKGVGGLQKKNRRGISTRKAIGHMFTLKWWPETLPFMCE